MAQKIKELKTNTKPRNCSMMKEKSEVINNATAFFKESKMVYNGFKSGIFPLPIRPIVVEPEKSNSSEYPTLLEISNSWDHSNDHCEYILHEQTTSGIGSKLLTPKQMLQKLLIALAKVQVVTTYENLLIGIPQITYYLYQAKEVTKKVYNNVMTSIKVWYKTDMNLWMDLSILKTVKTPESYRLLL